MGTADLCSPGAGAPAGMLHQLGLAGICLPTRSLQQGSCASLRGGSRSKRVKTEVIRPPTPPAKISLCPSGHVPLVKADPGPTQIQEEIPLGGMFSGPSEECSSMRWRKWHRTCGIFNAWPSLMRQELLNLPLGVWSSLLTGDAGMEAGEWRGGQPHRGAWV